MDPVLDPNSPIQDGIGRDEAIRAPPTTHCNSIHNRKGRNQRIRSPPNFKTGALHHSDRVRTAIGRLLGMPWN
jgi:hypothetical protein